METSRHFQAGRCLAHVRCLRYGGLAHRVEMPVFSLLSMQGGQEADLARVPDTVQCLLTVVSAIASCSMSFKHKERRPCAYKILACHFKSWTCLMYQNILVMLNMEISTPHTHNKMPRTHWCGCYSASFVRKLAFCFVPALAALLEKKPNTFTRTILIHKINFDF